MDPLTGVVLAVLTAYATDKGGKLLDAAGQASVETAKQIFARLKSAWSGNSTVSQELEAFEKEPQPYSQVIAARVDATLAENPELRKEVEALVEKIGPKVDVFQRIAKSAGVVGVDADRVKSGAISVKQEISDSEDVTGVRARDVG